jgi:hypothetical protein
MCDCAPTRGGYTLASSKKHYFSQIRPKNVAVQQRQGWLEFTIKFIAARAYSIPAKGSFYT